MPPKPRALPIPEEELLARRRAREGLLDFTHYTFPQFEDGPHHPLIAQHLEAVEQGTVRRLMIFLPPRHSKSQLTSRQFPAWYLGRNPDRFVIGATYGQDLANDFSRDVRAIVRTPEYGRLFPDVKVASDVAAAEHWRIEGRRGYYIAAGVGTAITGRGADLFLIDDPVKNREDADSQAMQERVWQWYRAVAFTRLQPGAAVILLMTRWHDMDLAGRLLEQANKDASIQPWTVLEMPAEATAADDPLGRALGEPLWPAWYNKEALAEIRATLGERDYQALYQQRPVRDEGEYFQSDWFQWYEEHPPLAEMTIYGASDYAVSEANDYGSKTDSTVHVVFGVDKEGYIYLLDCWIGQTNAKVWIEQLLDMVERWKPDAWAEERGQILKSVGPFLDDMRRKRGLYYRREQLTSSKDKTTRARAFQGIASSGVVHLPRRRPWGMKILHALTRFPAGKDDHIVDAFSLFGRLVDQIRLPKAKREQPKGLKARAFTVTEMVRRATLRAKGVAVRRGAPVLRDHLDFDADPRSDLEEELLV